LQVVVVVEVDTTQELVVQVAVVVQVESKLEQ
jgi:hypothetical protein